MLSDKELNDLLYYSDEFEYVRYVAFYYYPEYADETLSYPMQLPSIDELVNTPTQSEDEPTCIGIRNDGFRIFSDIQTGKHQFAFSREEYDDNVDIQQSLDLIGLDKDKFWHALLYIHYMAEINNTDCVPLFPSIHDEVKEIYTALSENGAVVKISRPGQRAITISRSETKNFVYSVLEFFDRKTCEQNNPTYNGRILDFSAAKEDVGARWQIYDEYRALMLLFKKYCTDKEVPRRSAGQTGSRNKDLLISRIFYFTRLTEDERFMDSCSPLHSIKNVCKKTRRPLRSDGF